MLGTTNKQIILFGQQNKFYNIFIYFFLKSKCVVILLNTVIQTYFTHMMVGDSSWILL